MNAYQVLGIVLQDNMSEQNIDNKIAEKATRILKNQIIEIENILKTSNMDEKTQVDKISNSISWAMNIVVSYLNISSQCEREKYNQAGKLNIAQLVEKMNSAIRFSGKTAYQIVGIVRKRESLEVSNADSEQSRFESIYFPLSRNNLIHFGKNNSDEHNSISTNFESIDSKSASSKEIYFYPESVNSAAKNCNGTSVDEKVCKNIYSMYFLAIKNIDIDSLKSMLGTIMNMEKYAWAYSKIKTATEREGYDILLDEEENREEYQDLRKRGTEKIKEIEVTRKFDKVHPWNYVLEGKFENKYRAIQISHIGTIEYGSKFIANENEVKEYRITKQKFNGEIIQKTIFTNIDYVKLQENEEYRSLVSETLLTDSKIHLGKKYLSGYIGSIDKDNNIEYDTEDAAVCIKWQNHLDEQKDENVK